MDEKVNQEYPYYVYYLHENGTTEDEKYFKKEEDAILYAKEIMRADSSGIGLIDWKEQLSYLEDMLGIPISCEREEFLVHLYGIGVDEEFMKEKVAEYGINSYPGNCSVIKGSSSVLGYKWYMDFNFKYGLHYILIEHI